MTASCDGFRRNALVDGDKVRLDFDEVCLELDDVCLELSDVRFGLRETRVHRRLEFDDVHDDDDPSIVEIGF